MPEGLEIEKAGFIEAELMADFSDGFGGSGFSGKLVGGVSGDEIEEDKGDEQDAQDGGDGVEEAADYGEFYVDVWEKNGHTVYGINESPYASGGAVEFTLFADKREDLEAACDDFGYDKSCIEGPSVACMQTL